MYRNHLSSFDYKYRIDVQPQIAVPTDAMKQGVRFILFNLNKKYLKVRQFGHLPPEKKFWALAFKEGDAVSRRARNVDVLDDAFLRDLHKRMFGEVWKWAGQYRRTPRNIGIDAYRIPMAVRELVHDARYWVDNGTYPPDEIAIRFSHRLVSIHPFPNGNGRHSRLVADPLAMKLDQSRFTWGRANLVDPGETRRAYVAALRAADGSEIEPLLAFARS